MSENGMMKPHWKKIKASYDESNVYECSVCGLCWELNEGTPYENEMYYCPCCGNKMDDFLENTELKMVVS